MINPRNDAEASTRERILQAAVELIAERGWGDVTTRAIAARAAANSALVHYYFGTKDALLREAALRAFAAEADEPTIRMFRAPHLSGLLRVGLEAIREVDPTSTNVRASLEAFLRASRDADMGSIVGELLDGYRKAIAERVADAREVGDLPDGLEVWPTAVLLTALLDGLLVHRLVDPELSLDGVEDALAALLAPRREGP